MDSWQTSKEKSDDYQSEKPVTQSLDMLHKLLREMTGDSDANPEEIKSLQQRIRAMIPRVDTGRSLPQKKTPGGKTKVLHMTYRRSQTDKTGNTEIEHLRFFARTVQDLGLRLEILTDNSCREDIEQELTKDDYTSLVYTITASQKCLSKWAEDGVEYLANGRVAVLRPLNDELLEWAMTEGRRRRWQGKITPENLASALQEDYLWILMGIRVNTDGISVGQECVARTKGQPVGHLRAYIEGGNMITGEDATGKPVVLIGKDAIATTAHIYQISNNDVRRLICEDFGLETIEQVVCVEQPGQFHLDMGILFIGEGVVIVNDSDKALKNAIEMAELAPCLTTERMAARLRLQCTLENEAAQDLKTAGMEVKRKKLESDTLYNFFNGEFVEGNDGFNYYITNGGLEDQEKEFEALMTTEWQVVKKVFFSPRKAAQKSLQDRGGVGCRLKGSR